MMLQVSKKSRNPLLDNAVTHDCQWQFHVESLDICRISRNIQETAGTCIDLFAWTTTPEQSQRYDFVMEAISQLDTEYTRQP